jgi:transglutaminase-like putative cysteine protease
MVNTGTQVGCFLTFEVQESAILALQVAVARRDGLKIDERFTVRSGDRPIRPTEIDSDSGGLIHLIRVEPGRLTIEYAATLEWEDTTPAQPPAGELDRLRALRPSRYCPSDRLAGFARWEFGNAGGRLETVRAIRDYVNRHTVYQAGTSGPTTDAADTLLAGQGVCRDFAHLMAALCRAVDIPARVAAVYAPGLSPMDFHAVVETEIDGVWRVWDATGLAPRPSLVRIATGADAADTAFTTVVGGLAELTELEIVAVAGGDLPNDPHDTEITLT